MQGEVLGRTRQPLTEMEKGRVDRKCTRTTAELEVGRGKGGGNKRKEGWSAIGNRWAFGDKGRSQRSSIENFNRVAGVLQDNKTGGGKGFNKLLSLCEPEESSASCCIIIHIATINKYMRNLVHMVIPGVHSNTEKKGTKGPTRPMSTPSCSASGGRKEERIL